MSAARVALRGVHAGYRAADALVDVSLEVGGGEALALVGENGSGKSTLLKVLAGLLRPRSGAVLLHGRPLHDVPRATRALALGYLPQGFEPFFPATALEVVLLGRTPHLRGLGGPGPRDLAIAREALAETDATALESVDVHEMSGGERQRVYLARVLAGQPEVLLLDEPTANLDPRHRLMVAAAIRRRVSAGAAIVFSTHELEVASAAASSAALLKAGRVVASGSLASTFTEPALSEVFDVTACVVPGAGGRPLVSFAPR